jgi:hypothetical protein
MWGSVAEYYSNNSRKWYLPCSSRWNQRLFPRIRGNRSGKKLARRSCRRATQKQSHSLLLECNEGLIIAAKLSFLRPGSLFQLRLWKLHVHRSG